MLFAFNAAFISCVFSCAVDFSGNNNIKKEDLEKLFGNIELKN